MSNFMSYENAQSVLGEFAEAIKSGGGGGGGDTTSLLTVTFDDEFVGASYTVQAVGGDTETYTGTVPADKKIVLHVKQCNVVYNVSASYNDSSYTNEIAVGQYYGVYDMHLYVYHIYGARWEASPSTVWERTDEAANFTDPVPYASGVTNYGSPFDNIYPWSGMIIEEDSTVGTLVKLPKFYYKLTEYGNGGLWIRISDKPAAGFEICPACRKHYTAVGDPEDYERDAVYIGRYISDSTYKSLSRKSWSNSGSFTAVWAGVHKLNPDAWVMDYDSWFTVMLLYLTEFANWSSTVICEPVSDRTTGGTNDMPYHTGTTGTVQGAAASSYQYRYIEAPYSTAGTYVNGCIVDRVVSSTIIPQRLYVYDRLSTRYQDMATFTKGEPWSKNVGVCYEDITVSGNTNYTAGLIPTSFKIIKGFFTFFLPTNGLYFSNTNVPRTYGYSTMRFINGSSSDSVMNTSFMIVGSGENYMTSGISACGASGSYNYTRLIFRGIPDNPIPN